MFNLSDNQHVYSLRGHIGVVNSLTVTPSGRFLISSSSDQTIMVDILFLSSQSVNVVGVPEYLVIDIFNEGILYFMQSKIILLLFESKYTTCFRKTV